MYIQKIEIKNLWGNDFLWTLNEDINVLIGKNGSGKSTIFLVPKLCLGMPSPMLCIV